MGFTIGDRSIGDRSIGDRIENRIGDRIDRRYVDWRWASQPEIDRLEIESIGDRWIGDGIGDGIRNWR